MFTLIIIIALLVFVVGYLKSLTPTQRSITIRYSINVLTLGTVYIFRALKEGFKIMYQAGRVSGTTMAIGGQASFKSMAVTNNEITTEGGAVKIAIKKSQSHGGALGLSNVAADLKAKADANALIVAEREAELEALLAL